jgi:hypothetical protein
MNMRLLLRGGLLASTLCLASCGSFSGMFDWLRDEGVDGPVCVVSTEGLEIDR